MQTERGDCALLKADIVKNEDSHLVMLSQHQQRSNTVPHTCPEPTTDNTCTLGTHNMTSCSFWLSLFRRMQPITLLHRGNAHAVPQSALSGALNPPPCVQLLATGPLVSRS